MLDVVTGTAKTREGLTNAERAVLAHVLASCSNRDIAKARAVASRTVANQMASLLRKMRIGCRNEALAAMMTRGSVERTPEGLIVRFVHENDLYTLVLRSPTMRASSPLSAEERAIVERVGRGMPDKMIASDLGVNAWVVSMRLSRLRKRLGLRGRAELALMWLTAPPPRARILEGVG